MMMCVDDGNGDFDVDDADAGDECDVDDDAPHTAQPTLLTQATQQPSTATNRPQCTTNKATNNPDTQATNQANPPHQPTNQPSSSTQQPNQPTKQPSSRNQPRNQPSSQASQPTDHTDERTCELASNQPPSQPANHLVIAMVTVLMTSAQKLTKSINRPHRLTNLASSQPTSLLASQPLG